MFKINPAVDLSKKALAEIRAIAEPLKASIKKSIKQGNHVHKAVKSAFRTYKISQKLEKIVLNHTDKARDKV